MTEIQWFRIRSLLHTCSGLYARHAARGRPFMAGAGWRTRVLPSDGD